MQQQPSQFRISGQAVEIEGGWLTGKIMVPVKIFSDMKFMSIDKTDRQLAKALGLSLSKRWPWGDIDVVSRLQKLRDLEIDRLIGQHMIADDPLADASLVAVPSAGRAQAFHDANVPVVIEVAYPAFTTNDGQRFPEFDVKVVTTPRRGSVVHMKLDEDHLNWLLAAVNNSAMAVPSLDLAEQLPLLSEPQAKWRKKHDAFVIMCRWKDQHGKWRHHLETPAKAEDPIIQVQLIREAELKVQSFYDRNHVEGDDGEDAGGEHADQDAHGVAADGPPLPEGHA